MPTFSAYCHAVCLDSNELPFNDSADTTKIRVTAARAD